MSKRQLTLAELQPHQIRVVTEFKILCTRVESLRAFVTSEKFKIVPNAEQVLLLRQLDAMSTYATMLDARLELWGVLV